MLLTSKSVPSHATHTPTRRTTAVHKWCVIMRNERKLTAAVCTNQSHVPQVWFWSTPPIPKLLCFYQLWADRFPVGFRSGNGPGHLRNFVSFILNQQSFPVCLGSPSCWHVYPHLHHPGRWVLKSGTSSIHASFSYTKHPRAVYWKPPPNVTVDMVTTMWWHAVDLQTRTGITSKQPIPTSTSLSQLDFGHFPWQSSTS